MKKTVFAAQVFGLLAMIPLVAILEMTHASKSSIENNTTLISEKIENTNIPLQEKLNDKMLFEPFNISLEIYW